MVCSTVARSSPRDNSQNTVHFARSRSDNLVIDAGVTVLFAPFSGQCQLLLEDENEVLQATALPQVSQPLRTQVFAVAGEPFSLVWWTPRGSQVFGSLPVQLTVSRCCRLCRTRRDHNSWLRFSPCEAHRLQMLTPMPHLSRPQQLASVLSL